MKKRLATILVLILAISHGLFAITYTTRMTDVSTHPDFWAGLFPSSIGYLIEYEDIEFIPGRITQPGIQLETGTLARSISRDPLTGATLASLSESNPLIGTNAYDTMYASFKVGMSQGFLYSKKADIDLITLRFSLEGQWEVSMDPLMQSENRSGHPFATNPIFIDSLENRTYLPGTPELSANRQLLSMSLNLYGKLNDIIFKTAHTNGISTEFKFSWAPEQLNLSKDYGGKADFWRFWFGANTGYTIAQKTDENGMNIFSIGFTDEFEMRVLGGKNVPKYAETVTDSIWWSEPENSRFLARNTLKIEYYGQQFLDSCVPYTYAFIDLSYNGGLLNNSLTPQRINAWTGSMGLHVELKMFNVIHVYYEIGKVFMYTGENPSFYTGYRTTETIKVSIVLKNTRLVDWSK